MRVVVAVPVRDEEDGLPCLLHALATQDGTSDKNVSLHLLFDGCTDRGVVIAEAFFAEHTLAGGLSVIHRSVRPNAGRARGASAELAISHLDGCSEAILLTTDADTVPASDWVARSVDALRFVDVIAGYTSRDRTTDLLSRDALETYLEDLHGLRRRIDRIPYDPAPSHPWVGGANLGMRLTAYRALGGFRQLETSEDNDLVDRARHAGLRVRHAREVRVTTSSRTTGRARGGLADALKHMQDEVGEPRVEHPCDAAQQYARHAMARRAYHLTKSNFDWRALESALGAEDDLWSLACKSVNAEAFVMKAVPHHPTKRDLPLSVAHRVLATLKAEQFIDHANA